VLKKANRKNAVAVDVRADDPTDTMGRFADGLRRVLAAPKPMSRNKRMQFRVTKRKPLAG
jgi:hypothetical protein